MIGPPVCLVALGCSVLEEKVLVLEKVEVLEENPSSFSGSGSTLPLCALHLHH